MVESNPKRRDSDFSADADEQGVSSGFRREMRKRVGVLKPK